MKNFNLSLSKVVLLFVLSLLYFQNELKAQDIETSLPKMLGVTNSGTEYYLTIPPCFEDESTGNANFIKIYVTSAVRTQVVVEVEGSGYYETKKTVANDIIEFNITPDKGQPYQKMGRDPNVPEAVFPGKGIHVTAEQPIVVYCMVRYKYTSDGFLAIPVSSLGKEYIVAGWNVDAMFRAVWNYKLPNICGIVAAFDDTRVLFTLGGNVMTKTAGGMMPGQSKQVVLRQGDVWMFSTDADEADLSGSKIVANKPVAVVTGNMCNNIPTGNQWCDYTVEMDIPTFTWGTDYHVPKVPNRKFTSPIRIFAKEPNTSYYKDGKKIGELKFAGGKEGEAFFTMRMVPFDEPPRSVVISGDKPIGVTLYNTGVQEDGYPLPNSDPFVMAITPLQQYQNEITFCTPGIMGGMGFPENYINFVYETDTNGLMPDDVEFATVVSGQFKWTKLGAKFPGEDEVFAYNVQGKKFAVKTITLPNDGVYKIRAKKPFAAYSFGYSYCDSYGYPTGAVLADMEKTDSTPPAPSYKVWCDGSVSGGVITDMPDDSKVRANLSMVVMDDLMSYNYDFQYLRFVPGETRTTTWRLDVLDPTQDAQAAITFTDRRGNDTTIIVKYNALKITLSTKIQDWGVIKTGSGETSRDFEVINESTTESALVSDIRIKNGFRNFRLDLMGTTMPKVLGPGQKIPFKVWFDAKETGTFADSIGIGDSCQFFYIAKVEAKSALPVIYSDDIDFGFVPENTTATKFAKIVNKGEVPLLISTINGPSNSAFSANLTSVILQPNETFDLEVRFTPTLKETYTDIIQFVSDAETNMSKSFCSLRGIGSSPSGVEEISENLAEIYPNPVNDRLTVNMQNDDAIAGLKLIDEKGAVILELQNLQSLEYNLNTEQYAAGNYFISIKTISGIEILKSIKIVR